MEDIIKVTEVEAREIVHLAVMEMEAGKQAKSNLNCYIAEEKNGGYIAIDNRTGDCWVEEFRNRDIAERWLKDEIDTDTALKVDLN